MTAFRQHRVIYVVCYAGLRSKPVRKVGKNGEGSLAEIKGMGIDSFSTMTLPKQLSGNS